MKKLTLREAAEAVKGILVEKNVKKDDFIKNVSTDSRSIAKGDLFIPIVGEKFDGHNFIEAAFNDGAICALSEINLETEHTYIKVENTKKALMDLAEYYRGLFDIPVVAVTGSVGKTTTKDMISSVLSKKYNVLKTEGNFNNEIGVPLTVFRLEEGHEALVLEMGMNHFGEIHNLSKIGKPDIAVITNIGVSHIENLGSREGILKAKTEIFDYMDDNSKKILNGDDDMLITLKGKESNSYYYGLKNENLFYADNIVQNGLLGIKCTLHTPKYTFEVKVPLPGIHMVYNVLSAAAAGELLGLNEAEIKDGIESFKPSKMRMDIIKTEKFTVINDVYNANPVSVKAGIDVLGEAKQRTVCILGDMFELGENADKYHAEVGEYAAEKNIDIIICIGELSKHMYDGANKKKNDKQKIYYFKTQEDFFEKFDGILKKGDNILVKASRGMHFEKTMEMLTKFH